MTWALFMFVFNAASVLFEGTAIETGMDFQRCMAKAVSMRFSNVSEQQFICLPEAEVETKNG